MNTIGYSMEEIIKIFNKANKTICARIFYCCFIQFCDLISISEGIQISICGLLPKSANELMLGFSTDVKNSWKNIPEHKILANIANTDKNQSSNCSELLTSVVLAESPAVPNDKPNVLKKMEPKSLYLDFMTDRIIFRKTAKISMASIHTLSNGISKMDRNSVDCLSNLLGTTIIKFSSSWGYSLLLTFRFFASRLNIGSVLLWKLERLIYD